MQPGIPLALLAALATAACGGSDEHLPPTSDGPPADAPAIDAPMPPVDAGPNGVVCNAPGTSCPVPGQVCCDVVSGTDTCVAAGACNATTRACDGPEDCAAGQECCQFSDRAMCLGDGLCGTTGSDSAVMCHDVSHCETGETCCGTAPGPMVDLYAVCRSGPCPQ